MGQLYNTSKAFSNLKRTLYAKFGDTYDPSKPHFLGRTDKYLALPGEVIKPGDAIGILGNHVGKGIGFDTVSKNQFASVNSWSWVWFIEALDDTRFIILYYDENWTKMLQVGEIQLDGSVIFGNPEPADPSFFIDFVSKFIVLPQDRFLLVGIGGDTLRVISGSITGTSITMKATEELEVDTNIRVQEYLFAEKINNDNILVIWAGNNYSADQNFLRHRVVTLSSDASTITLSSLLNSIEELNRNTQGWVEQGPGGVFYKQDEVVFIYTIIEIQPPPVYYQYKTYYRFGKYDPNDSQKFVWNDKAEIPEFSQEIWTPPIWGDTSLLVTPNTIVLPNENSRTLVKFKITEGTTQSSNTLSLQNIVSQYSSLFGTSIDTITFDSAFGVALGGSGSWSGFEASIIKFGENKAVGHSSIISIPSLSNTSRILIRKVGSYYIATGEVNSFVVVLKGRPSIKLGIARSKINASGYVFVQTVGTVEGYLNFSPGSELYGHQDGTITHDSDGGYLLGLAVTPEEILIEEAF